MAQIEVVVIGASAGGLEALTRIFAKLPPRLRSSVFVVIHIGSEATSYLPRILSRAETLPVQFAIDRARIKNGRIYIAPPDMHVVLRRGTMRLSHGPKENGFRPAVDPLFRSAARAYGPAALGVILSGALDDGTYGLRVIKDAGGMAIVQDPDEAAQPGMILSALRFVEVDKVLPSDQIGEFIARCCGVDDEPFVEREIEGEGLMAREPDPQNADEETDVEEMNDDFGPPSGLTCPDCGGALWEIRNGKLARYRCHVGHQYTTDGLDSEQREVVEGALWTAVRVLEEHADLRRRMAARAHDAGMASVASGFEASAHTAHRQAHTIRELLFGRALPESPPARTLKKAASQRAAKSPARKKKKKR